MRQFESEGPPRIVFGRGSEGRAREELTRLGAKRVWVCCSARYRADAERVAAALGPLWVGTFTEAEPQVPHQTAAAAVQSALGCEADWLLAHGGGTAIGTAKAVALELKVGVAAIPTTYAGSEMTDIWGVTRDGVKTTGRDPRVRPGLVIYDPDLLQRLRPEVATTSLFNALAHSIEALYSADPEIRSTAEESAEAILSGLTDGGAGEALYGAMLAGKVLGQAPMALHHKLAHVLGGSFGTPHASTHTALLPYTTHFNLKADPQASAALARAFGTAHPAAFLWDLADRLGAPTSLDALGFGHNKIDEAVGLALMKRYANPRVLTADSLRTLLSAAVDGDRPSETP